MSNEIFDDKFDCIIDEYKSIIIEYGNKVQKISLYSKKYLDFIFINYILEDLILLKKISNDMDFTISTRVRFIGTILRSTIEQIILYRYLTIPEKQQEIKKYFGSNICNKTIEYKGTDTEKIFKDYKKLIEKRFNKLSVEKMNDMVKDKYSKQNDEDIDLYNIYMDLSDFTHDGYYQEFKQKQEELNGKDVEIWYSRIKDIVIIMSESFLEAYNCN